MDAVHAKRAVHIAYLQWLEQRQLATAPPAREDIEAPRRVTSSADAILRPAFKTDFQIPRLYFKRRDR
jgi:hypothetical protein